MTRCTEEQIAFALNQAETGTRVEEVCRKIGVSESTLRLLSAVNGEASHFSGCNWYRARLTQASAGPVIFLLTDKLKNPE